MIEWGKRGTPEEIAAPIIEVYRLLVAESGDPMPEIRLPRIHPAGESGTVNGIRRPSTGAPNLISVRHWGSCDQRIGG